MLMVEDGSVEVGMEEQNLDYSRSSCSSHSSYSSSSNSSSSHSSSSFSSSSYFSEESSDYDIGYEILGKKQAPKKLTWNEVDYLWKEHNLSIGEIEKVPGFENFELTDTLVIDHARDIEKIFAHYENKTQGVF